MFRISLGLLPLLLLLWPLQSRAANFTFSYSEATQCDDFQVSWQGGTSPFTLTIVPSFGTPRTFQIPDGSFSNNKGKYSTTLPIASGSNIVAVMSDSTGFGSGGVTTSMTVGKSTGQTSCNTTDPGVDFFFETNSALSQCRTYVFSGYTGAVQPVTIKGIVPGGSVFILDPPKGGTNFNWVTDVAAGTQLIFVMEDSQGRQGGSTEFLSVGMSDDKTCLDNNSPSSAASAPSLTATTTSASATQTGSDTSGNSTTDNSSNAGTVAAAVVGVLVGMAVVGSLIWFYLRRRNRGTAPGGGGFFGGRFQKQEIDLGDAPDAPHTSLNPYPLYATQARLLDEAATPNSSADMLGGARDSAPGHRPPSTLNFANAPASTIYSPTTANPGSAYESSGHGGPGYGAASQASRSQYDAGSGSQYGGAMGRVASWNQSVTPSAAARRKAAQAGVSAYQPAQPARFILHTDIEDDIPPPPEDEIIELPPQYSERRAPMQGQPEAGSSSSSGAAGASASAGPSGWAYGDVKRPPPP